MRITVEDISRIIGAEIPAHGKHHEILGLASIEDAGPDQICFLSNPKYAKYLETTRAGAVIVARGTKVPDHLVALRVEDPYFSFLKLLDHFNTRQISDIAEN